MLEHCKLFRREVNGHFLEAEKGLWLYFGVECIKREVLEVNSEAHLRAEGIVEVYSYEYSCMERWCSFSVVVISCVSANLAAPMSFHIVRVQSTRPSSVARTEKLYKSLHAAQLCY